MSDKLKQAIDKALASNPNRALQSGLVLAAVQEVFDRETKDLQHFQDAHCGLYAFDKDPERVSLEWIRENCFRIKPIKSKAK